MFEDHDHKGSVEDWLTQQLKYGKSNYNRWGRMVLRAIDVDDGLALIDIFVHKKDVLGSNMNVQTTIRGYEGHIWTAWIHSHIGDTALHIAIKQKRMVCIYALLLINVDVSIRNEDGETAAELCQRIIGIPLKTLHGDARQGLSPCIDPRSFTKLPDSSLMRNMSREAWYLMEHGRCCYVELPNSNKIKATNSNFVEFQGVTACEKVNELAQKEAAKHQKEVTRVLTAGEAAVGNVWGSNDITDTVRLITNQMDRRRRIDRACELKSSGLGLLSALQEIDSTVVTSTLGTTHTGAGSNAITNESIVDTGASAISGMDEGDNDSLVASEAPEVNPNPNNALKAYDNTPFSVSLLPAHVRQSQGSMAGIKNLSFLRLNKKKAQLADKIALDKGFMVDPDEVKAPSLLKIPTTDADDMAIYDSMIVPDAEPKVVVSSTSENDGSVSIASQGQNANSGSKASPSIDQDDGSFISGSGIGESIGTSEIVSLKDTNEKKTTEGELVLEVKPSVNVEEAKESELMRSTIETDATITNTKADKDTLVESKKISFAKSLLKMWGGDKKNTNTDIENEELTPEEKVQRDLEIYRAEQEEINNRLPVSVPENPDFLKVSTDIPVVKSKRPFPGTLLSTVAEAPMVIKDASMYQNQRKIASKKKEKTYTRHLELVLCDDGTEEYVEIMETDEDNDENNELKHVNNEESASKEITDFSKPFSDELKVLSQEEELIIKAFARFGITEEVLEKNAEAGYNTDEFLSLVSVKEIVHLSTFHNLKYMNVGDKGLLALTQALTNDYIVQYMMLDHAHITGVGVRALCKHIHTMSMLCYLDLSQNAVDDNGACALAVALENCYIGSSNYHFHKLREAEDKRLLLLSEQQSVASASASKTSFPDARSVNTALNTPISNVASNIAVDNTPIVIMKKLPLHTLVLRANRITDVGATALLNAVEKITNKLNYSRLDKNRCIQDDIDLSVCEVRNELPKWVPGSDLDHVLKPNETPTPNLRKTKKVQNNFFGLTRPEKKFYPRNPLKKVVPAPNPEEVVALPLSDDTRHTFLTSTSKIKAALLPQVSKQTLKPVNHRANAVVPFYLNLTINPISLPCKEKHYFKYMNNSQGSNLKPPITDMNIKQQNKETYQKYMHCQVLI